MIDPEYDLHYEDVLDMIEAYSFEGLVKEVTGTNMHLQAEMLLDMHNMGLVDLGAYTQDDYS